MKKQKERDSTETEKETNRKETERQSDSIIIKWLLLSISFLLEIFFSLWKRKCDCLEPLYLQNWNVFIPLNSSYYCVGNSIIFFSSKFSLFFTFLSDEDQWRHSYCDVTGFDNVTHKLDRSSQLWSPQANEKLEITFCTLGDKIPS